MNKNDDILSDNIGGKMESLDFFSNITDEFASYHKTKEHLHAHIVPK